MKNIFKLTPKTIAIALGVVWFVLVVVGATMIAKEEAKVNKDTIPFVPPVSWSDYRNEDIEFQYPQDWTLSPSAPVQFHKFMKSGEYCEGLVFYNEQNPDVLLVVQSSPRSITDNYSPLLDCWTAHTFVSGRTMKSASSTQSFEVFQTYALGDDLVEQYDARNPFPGLWYQFSLIYPKALSEKITPVFDSIANSVVYVKKEKPVVVETIAWSKFESTKLGFSFEYPSVWGTTKEKITDYAGGMNQPYGYVAERGKGYVLSFSNPNFSVYGVGQSADFTAGREGISTDYRGDRKLPAGVIPDVYTKSPDYCSDVAGFHGDVVPSTPHVIKFNLPNREIGGVMLVAPGLSSKDFEKYAKIMNDFKEVEINCTDALKDDWGAEKMEQAEARLIAKEKEISEMLQNGVGLDAESELNLKIYQHILESARVF